MKQFTYAEKGQSKIFEKSVLYCISNIKHATQKLLHCELIIKKVKAVEKLE